MDAWIFIIVIILCIIIKPEVAVYVIPLVGLAYYYKDKSAQSTKEGLQIGQRTFVERDLANAYANEKHVADLYDDEMRTDISSDSAKKYESQYGNQLFIDQLFDGDDQDDTGEDDNKDGDDKLYDRAKYTSDQHKESKLIRSRFTSDNFRKYFVEELDEQEKRHWWEHDALDEFMRKREHR